MTINPEQVTSLRSPSAQFRQMVPAGHCIVDLADRKFIAVLESCDEVKRQLEAPE